MYHASLRAWSYHLCGEKTDGQRLRSVFNSELESVFGACFYRTFILLSRAG